MGEISDSMIEGEVCGGCGVFFRIAHEFPVLCGACWLKRMPSERAGYQRATEEEA